MANTRYQISLAFVFLAIFVVMLPAKANHTADGAWQSEQWNAQHVVVFEDCGYKGKAKLLPMGNYAKLPKVGISNNRISSMIIPTGLAVEIFQKSGFRGHWYRLNLNQECLRGKWNDSVSGIRVVSDEPATAFGRQAGYEQDISQTNCHNYQLYSDNGDGAIRFVEKERRLNVMQSNRLDGQICQSGNVQIELAKQNKRSDVILRVANREYGFYRKDAYHDFRRDWYRKYISIQLPHSQSQLDEGPQAGWENTRGFGQRYSSGVKGGKNWGNNYRGEWWKPAPVIVNNSNQSNCTTYRVEGRGRDTGIRFLNVKDFSFVGNGKVTDKVCYDGEVIVELAKKKPTEEISLTINGKTYQFPPGDAGDRFERHWYRKYIRINL